MRKRADQVLVELGLASSRTRAKDLISAKRVLWKKELVSKASQSIDESEVEVLAGEDFSSRGAFKLKSAHEAFQLSFEEKVIADVGASTGGFTDYCLKFGARRVFAIDVGHDQLDQKLKEDSRVVDMPGTNIKDLEVLPELVDMIVSDLSFISLSKVLSSMLRLLKPKGELVLLFKPQFEVGRKYIEKNGLVKDVQRVEEVLQDFFNFSKSLGLIVVGVEKSLIKGRTGNQEFLIYLKREK